MATRHAKSIVAMFIWRAFVTITVVMTILFAVDITWLRSRQETAPTLSVSTSQVITVQPRRLIVYLTGFDSSGVKHSAHHVPTWRKYGDVLVVEYPRRRFDGAKVVSAVRHYITSQPATWPYERLTIIGASMGGMLADDVILATADLRIPMRDVILVDTPTGTDDLFYSEVPKKTGQLRLGPVYDDMNRWWWSLLSYHPPPPDTLGKGVDWPKLHEHYEASRTYPLNGQFEESSYIAKHPPLIPNPARNGVKAIFIRSTHDNIVMPIAAEHWQAVYPHLPAYRADSNHIGFMEYPDEWDQVFKLVFGALDATG